MGRSILIALAAALALGLAFPAALGATAILEDAPPAGVLSPQADAAPPSSASALDAAYTVRFVCPETAAGTGVPVACPAYVLDHEDVMGSPRLVVDPRDATKVAFGALHGGRGLHAPGSEPPTGRSRDDAVHQPHTTFATGDGGRTWLDMPYHAPDALRQAGREIYGDDHAIALDGEGRLVLGALYSYRASAGAFSPPGPFENVVATWKARTIDRPVDYHVNLALLEPTSGPGARIDSIHLAYAPVPDAVVLTWRETPATGDPFLALHWSATSEGAAWHAQDVGIGPCAAVTNPLPLATGILVGCAENATGPWTVHRIDPATWTSAPAGQAPVTTPRALLVPRFTDHVVLVGSGLAEDATPTVQLSYGDAGERWSSIEEIAPSLTRGDVSTPMLDARVTAAAYNPLSGNLHLTYLERYDLGQGGEQSAGRPEFYKAFASIQAEGAFQTRLDLGIGTVNRAAFSPTLTGVGGGAYDDLHDGIVVWTDPRSGAVREFLAFGDYGFVRFAEVLEENFLTPIAPLSAQVPAVPVASAGSVPVLVGVPAGILAGAMVARTLWARKAAAAEAPSE